ncbi:MAG: ATP-dependent Clp protease proteolytic subunit [Campylobacterota bacterium]|nr:ATP-dependent Clp protease proteolytic subunit [Campylobacterota bacterium]
MLDNTTIRRVEKDEKLNSSHHTMFKNKVATKYIPIGKNNYKKESEYIQYRIFIDKFFEQDRGLHDIFNELWNAKYGSKLELRINSRGGLVNEGSQFYNLIKNKFKGNTTTILDNAGYSMGALTFCMGDKRVITKRSDLMFHDYSGGAIGKGGEIESRVEHTSKHLRKFFKDIIVKNKFLTIKEFENMLIGKDYWFDYLELLKRGIATHILIDGKEITAKRYLKNRKKNKNN